MCHELKKFPRPITGAYELQIGQVHRVTHNTQWTCGWNGIVIVHNIPVTDFLAPPDWCPWSLTISEKTQSYRIHPITQMDPPLWMHDWESCLCYLLHLWRQQTTLQRVIKHNIAGVEMLNEHPKNAQYKKCWSLQYNTFKRWPKTSSLFLSFWKDLQGFVFGGWLVECQKPVEYLALFLYSFYYPLSTSLMAFSLWYILQGAICLTGCASVYQGGVICQYCWSGNFHHLGVLFTIWQIYLLY